MIGNAQWYNQRVVQHILTKEAWYPSGARPANGISIEFEIR